MGGGGCLVQGMSAPGGVSGPGGAWSGGLPGPGEGVGIPACTEADPPCEQNHRQL